MLVIINIFIILHGLTMKLITLQTFYFSNHVVRMLTRDSTIACDTSRDVYYHCYRGLCRFRTVFMSATHAVGVTARPSFTICQSFNRITHQRGMRSRYRDYAAGWTKDRAAWFDSWWEGEHTFFCQGSGSALGSTQPPTGLGGCSLWSEKVEVWR